MSSDAYAGVRRRKQTPWRVKFGDALVSRLIAIGGIGTIAAVLLVVLVLLATAWPLHRSPSLSNWQTLDLAGDIAPNFAGSDEYGLIVWTADDQGKITLASAADGRSIGEFPGPAATQAAAVQPAEAAPTDANAADADAADSDAGAGAADASAANAEPAAASARRATCACLSIDRQTLTLGFDDGTFQSVTFAFQSDLLAPAQVPEDVRLDSEHPIAVSGQAVYHLFAEGAVRRVELTAPQWSAPAKVADEPLQAIDYLPPDTSNQFSQQGSSTLLAATDSELVVAQIESRENMLTGQVTQEINATRSPLEKRSKKRPLGLMLANRASHAIIAWDTGTLDRFAIEPTGPANMESVSGLVDGGRLTAAAILIGRQTLLLGDEKGRLHGWNIVQSDEAGAASDGYRLVATHEVPLSSKPVKSIASSSASHLALVATEDANLSLVMTTTDTLLRRVPIPSAQEFGSASSSAFLTPKNDGVFVVSPRNLTRAALDVAYPEATLRALFGKVWYEGHAEPKYIWQSSAGTEQSEPKLSLIPLIFGTVKATFYAMIFSVPLALLAAVYTSEFLSPRMRSRVKPLIELMASLPSVILGFVAALVLAPLLQEH
ncbi:MAG: hypothetical protein ACTHK7_10310, partial [Aureliella sp.]